MKITTILIGLIFLAPGCNTTVPENSDTEQIEQSASQPNNKTGNDSENTLDYSPAYALWSFELDTILKDFKLVKLKEFNKDTLTVKSIETIVNKTYPKVQIKYLRTSRDTVFISIPESEVLTQQMGTTGANQFMISTTYSFTELTGIKYVSYDFEEGDHANPGVYSRKSWDRK